MHRNGEFVVHIADEGMAEQMHRCGETVPSSRALVHVFTFTPVTALRWGLKKTHPMPSTAGALKSNVL